MVKEALVERNIDQGQRLVEALDQTGFPVVAALWSFLPEEEEWRLLIASPKVNELGPLAAYTAIQDALIKRQIDLPLHHISALSPDDPPIPEFRIFAGTEGAPFIGGTYFQKVVVGDLYIEGAYVYRAERIIGKSGTFELWVATPDAARKVWTTRKAKVSIEDGFFTKLEVEGGDWPQTHAKHGLNAHLGVVSSVEERGGEAFGDVEKWTILGGRLRSVETVARKVPLQGYPVSSPAG